MTPPPPFLLHKGGMRFFCNGRDGKFWLEMGEKPGMGIGFTMWGWDIFKVPLHSWQRDANLLFYEDNIGNIGGPL